MTPPEVTIEQVSSDKRSNTNLALCSVALSALEAMIKAAKCQDERKGESERRWRFPRLNEDCSCRLRR